MMTPAEVERLLAEAFPDAELEVTDLTGTADHFHARVVSAAFVGKTRVQQHQLVYAALAEALRGPIHALALETHTPQAWAERAGDD